MPLVTQLTIRLANNIGVLAGVYETDVTSALVDGARHIAEGAAGGTVIGLLYVRRAWV